ncbi:MAG: Crp/Fnr family transcriptional regulator [Eubacteriales bacterium]|nr:Crp/Fnr family transcriptional regulator [Eubacteriales bacterium]MDD3350228.1 Crp/Fnr family transcriptional regulator [Eubacteriales bacterium]
MSEAEKTAFLREVLTFWDKLTEEEKELLKSNAQTVKYKQGEHVHSGENDCVGVLLIKSGELRTYILSEDGREITLYRQEKGNVCILSASCILKNITFDVMIDAEQDTEVLLINTAVFEKVCSQNVFAENFSYRIATDRFSDVMWAMQQMLFMSFDKRLAIFLSDEISKTGSETIRLTHEQIASYVGSAREVVSRMLKYFEREGLVVLSRGAVQVLDKKKLRALI